MLAITRKIGQEVHIGPDIKIRILGVNEYGQVRLGLDAPEDMKIRRPEAFGPDDGKPIEELK